MKEIPRWMNGTCLQCEPIRSETDELYIFSYYEDIIQVQVVHDVVMKVQDTTHRLISHIHLYLGR